MKKYILFGAGAFGKIALEDYGADRVECFADNNPSKSGLTAWGKQIIDFGTLKKIEKDFQIVISVGNVEAIARQLEESGIFDYQIYSPLYRNLKTYLPQQLKNKNVQGIALYSDGDVRRMVEILQESGMGSQIQCIAVPEDTETGTHMAGYPVYSLQEVPREVDCYLVATPYKHAALREQLQQAVKQGFVLDPFYLRAFYDTNEIVVRQSPDQEASEEDWNRSVERDRVKEEVKAYVEAVKQDVPLFSFVEIETINRCNGICSFCPVNQKADPRPKAVMSKDLFERIIGQLEELDYGGELALFSNNEPLLDERIVDLHKYAREHLPKARIHLYTNGTLLTIPKFEALIQYLDELVIDNYQQELRLIRPSREIIEYVEAHPDLREKVTVVLRKPYEILTSRGGDAPNRTQMVSYAEETCALPFQQLIIRPDGKVSLCCNDPLGRCTLGDLTEGALLDVWYGPQFQMVRKCLAEGRKNWKHCEYCDTFYVY